MFCHTLRRRPSTAPLIPILLSPSNLGLRGKGPFPRPIHMEDSNGSQLHENKALTTRPESHLGTHDLSISLSTSSPPPPSSGANATRSSEPAGYTTASAQLHKTLLVLILTPSTVTDEALPDTLSRIERFATLTGGSHVAIIFFLHENKQATRMATTSTSTKSVFPTPLHALQALMSALVDSQKRNLLCVPILPLKTAASLPALLKPFLSPTSGVQAQYKGSGGMRQESAVTHLLPYCTASAQPLSDETIDKLSNLGGSLGEIAQWALGSQDTGGLDSEGVDMHVDVDRMDDGNRAGDEEETRGVREFWREEWVVDG